MIHTTDAQGGKVNITFESGARLEKGKYYEIVLEVAEPNAILKISGGTWLDIHTSAGSRIQYLTEPVTRLTENAPFEVSFMAQTNATVYSVQFGHIVDILNLPVSKTISIAIIDPGMRDQPLGYGKLTDIFLMGADPRGDTRWIELEKPAVLEEGKVYTVQLTMEGKQGAIGLFNDVLVMESSWDDAIPLGLSGYGSIWLRDGVIRQQSQP